MTTLLTLDQRIRGGPSIGYQRIRRHLDATAKSRPPVEREAIACAFVTYGDLLDIGDLLPYGQGVHETGFFNSWWWVHHYNPAGLGVTGATQTAMQGASRGWKTHAPPPGWVWDPARNLYIEGWHYPTPAHGILSQLVHLLAYAARDDQLSEAERLLLPFDPRLPAIEQKGWRGVAQTWVELNGRWAFPGTTYFHRILIRTRRIIEETA